MPRNFKEALLFTILMCGMMVCGMSLWNLLILLIITTRLTGGLIKGYKPILPASA